MNRLKSNLSQLVALDALLTERNVTRAGEKLCITQSAMSNVLRQLREIFHDDLLVMKGRTLQLTHRAQELYPKIKQLLSQAETIFESPAFDPKTSQRKFVIGMEEYTNYSLLPELYYHLKKNAPHIELNIKNVPYFEDKSMLESQEIELAVGPFFPYEKSKNINHDLLFKERLVCIGSKMNPLFKKKLTLKSYLEADHVSLTINKITSAFGIDDILRENGHQRRILLRLPHIVPALYTIAKGKLIATVPEGIANEAKRLLDVSIQPCPFSIPPISFFQVWHSSTNHDNGLSWLRKMVRSVLNKTAATEALCA